MTDFESSTEGIPDTAEVPRHVAIIMDGNGRWAKKRFLPRVGGHRRGVETVREIVKACIRHGVEYLTIFAFSSENWRRPPEEVSFLMQLFLRSLEQEVGKLHDNGIRFKVAGDLSPFDARIVELIRRGIFELPLNLKRNHVSYAHTDADIDLLLEETQPAVLLAAQKLARGDVRYGDDHKDVVKLMAKWYSYRLTWPKYQNEAGMNQLA